MAWTTPGAFDNANQILEDSIMASQLFGSCWLRCPLSPFLFGMLMTVLISDAKASYRNQGHLSSTTLVSELLYADDTLLVDVDAHAVEAYMHCVQEAGATYGLAFNWKKLELLSLGEDYAIKMPDGRNIKQTGNMVYLGCVLSRDGSSGSELSRRLGAAQDEFGKLAKVWAHCNVTRHRKVEIYSACVLSKLLYNLHSLWLSPSEERKLDAFHCKCLRRILHIQPSFHSHVTKRTVIEKAKSHKLSVLLLERINVYGCFG